LKLALGETLARQEPPKTFQLLTNYRSHNGIVKCAHSVVQLITTFWPYAIDILAEERGKLDADGIKPVFYTGQTVQDAHCGSFLINDG